MEVAPPFSSSGPHVVCGVVCVCVCGGTMAGASHRSLMDDDGMQIDDVGDVGLCRYRRAHQSVRRDSVVCSLLLGRFVCHEGKRVV